MSRPSTTCPEAGTLVSWLDDALGEDERARVAAHLESCSRCRRAVEAVRSRRREVSAWLAAHDVPPPSREDYDLTPRGTGARGPDRFRTFAEGAARGRERGWWALAASVVLAVAVVAGPARGWILERLGIDAADAPAAAEPDERTSTSFVPTAPELTVAFTAVVPGRTLVVSRGAPDRATLVAPRPDPEVLVGPDRIEVRDGDVSGTYRLEVPPSVATVRLTVPGAPDVLITVRDGPQVLEVPSGGR